MQLGSSGASWEAAVAAEGGATESEAGECSETSSRISRRADLKDCLLWLAVAFGELAADVALSAPAAVGTS